MIEKRSFFVVRCTCKVSLETGHAIWAVVEGLSNWRGVPGLDLRGSCVDGEHYSIPAAADMVAVALNRAREFHIERVP